MGPCFPEMPLLGIDFSERNIEGKKKTTPAVRHKAAGRADSAAAV